MTSLIALYVSVCFATDRGGLCREARIGNPFPDVESCESAREDTVKKWHQEFAEVFEGVWWIKSERCGPSTGDGDEM